MFNLNRSHKPDYLLNTKLMDEMINMYGVECDYLYTEKINIDSIMMDFSHLKLSEKNSKKIYILPENTQNWENEFQFNIFGLENKRYVNFYISRNTLIELAIDDDFSKLINSLLVTPSGTILEISSVTDKFENINNLFLYDDISSVLRITCIPYYAKEHNELEYNENSETESDATGADVTDTGVESGVEIDYQSYTTSDNYEDEFMNLDDFFNALNEKRNSQNEDGDVISNSDSVFGNLG